MTFVSLLCGNTKHRASISLFQREKRRGRSGCILNAYIACLVHNRAGGRRLRGCRCGRRCKRSAKPSISSGATAAASRYHVFPSGRRPLHRQSSIDGAGRTRAHGPRRCGRQVAVVRGPDDNSACGCFRRGSPPKSADARRLRSPVDETDEWIVSGARAGGHALATSLQSVGRQLFIVVRHRLICYTPRSNFTPN